MNDVERHEWGEEDLVESVQLERRRLYDLR